MPTKTKKVHPVVTRLIPVSEIIDKYKFDSFDSLRKETYKQVAFIREEWLRELLNRNGIVYSDKLTKRQISSLLSRHKISITREKDEKSDYDRVYKDGELIGEWNNKTDIYLGRKDGALKVMIQYTI